MFTLLAMLIAFDIARLGHPDWSTREAAEHRLRAWGLIAVPALLRAAQSDNPEVRFRATAMLGRWLSIAADYRAAAVIACPWEISPVRLYADEDLRRRTYRIAIASGCKAGGEIERLLPETYVQCGWFWNWMPSARCAGALRIARIELGYAFCVRPVAVRVRHVGR